LPEETRPDDDDLTWTIICVSSYECMHLVFFIYFFQDNYASRDSTLAGVSMRLFWKKRTAIFAIWFCFGLKTNCWYGWSYPFVPKCPPKKRRTKHKRRILDWWSVFRETLFSDLHWANYVLLVSVKNVQYMRFIYICSMCHLQYVSLLYEQL